MFYPHRQGVIIMQKNLDYAKLGKRIKDTRLKSKITQDELAEMVDCSLSHISNVENNHTQISLSGLVAIANALNTSVDYLLLDQYTNSTLALDNEIVRAISNCDVETKERILRIINAL